MTDQSVDAAASTSNKRKKLTDEERLERKREYNKRWHEKNKERVNAKRRQWNQDNPDQVKVTKKKYYDANKKKICRYKRQWSHENKVKLSDYYKKHYDANKDKYSDRQRNYRKRHKRKVAESARQYVAGKRREDTAYKLATTLRNRLRDALRGKSKTGSAVRDMGCTGQEACDYLESLFDEHMTWDNWGTYWEVDHIYPLAAANLEDRIEFLAVVNWRNLQPLEKFENRSKGDTVTSEAQKLFDDLKTQFRKENAA